MSSSYVREQIEKRLKELRYNCGLQRLHLRNAHGRRWSGCERRNPEKPDSWEKYWEDLQAKAQLERPKAVEAADRELKDFIAEHRELMGPEWIGNDHGRLCWAPYLGGCPIEQHYCQLAEGHEGKHCNAFGCWPQGVTCEREWHELNKRNAEVINAR